MAMATGRLTPALGLWILFAGSPSAFAQPVGPALPREAVVPVERANYHQPVFANDDIDVLNNLYPPGGDSGFHAHHRDLFYVILQPSPSRGQTQGQPLTSVPAGPAGAAGYSAVGATPRVHRVINDGDGSYHILVVQIRRPAPLGAAVSDRSALTAYEQILDNPRLRAWRMILKPGQSVAAIPQRASGIRIVVRGGSLTATSDGGPEQKLALRAGDFAVQDSGPGRALRNSGTDTIELVEMELK